MRRPPATGQHVYAKALALFASLTPAAAAGIAIVLCVAGVFGTQLAARAWREVDDNAPGDGIAPFALAHVRATLARARARAEAAQLAATAVLVTAACVAPYAIVPGLATEGIGILALAGCIYLVADAWASCVAELRSISDDEALDAFRAQTPEASDSERWNDFALAHPHEAKRILRRRPGAASEPLTFA